MDRIPDLVDRKVRLYHSFIYKTLKAESDHSGTHPYDVLELRK
jgi:hypothetical protein